MEYPEISKKELMKFLSSGEIKPLVFFSSNKEPKNGTIIIENPDYKKLYGKIAIILYNYKENERSLNVKSYICLIDNEKYLIHCNKNYNF